MSYRFCIITTLIVHLIDDDDDDDDEFIHHAEIGINKGLQVFVDQHSNRVTAGSIYSTSK